MAASTHTFFCGVAGHGMQALALYLAGQGQRVSGSDRSFDQGENRAVAATLRAAGIALHPQDGTGVTPDITRFVLTRVVEDDVADVARARALGLDLVMRPVVLAALLAAARTVCIAGTSGKTTTTALTGYLLERLGADPTIFCGSDMRNFGAHLRVGRSDLVVIETDESGGDDDLISLVTPSVAVAHNLSLDHRPVADNLAYFERFVARASAAAALNADDPLMRRLAPAAGRHRVTYGLSSPADVCASDVELAFERSRFAVDGQTFELPLAGAHNVSNALAAIAVCREMGFSLADVARAMPGFAGTARRFDLIGERRGVRVVDDFAHNPDKLAAVLDFVSGHAARIVAVFQPHGLAPSELMRPGYVDAFATRLRPHDVLILQEIYRLETLSSATLSSRDLVTDLAARGRVARFCSGRQEIVARLAAEAREGDVILVLGARDPTLPDFARDILAAL